MISLDSSLCTGCGICVDACPVRAISLVKGQVSIDANLCDACGMCVQVCPDQALALIIEPDLAIAAMPTVRAIAQPSTDIIDGEIRHVVPWSRAVRPAVGTFLSWAGHELVPRLVPLALDALEAVLDRQLLSPTKATSTKSVASNLEDDHRQRRRRRHRFGRTQK